LVCTVLQQFRFFAADKEFGLPLIGLHRITALQLIGLHRTTPLQILRSAQRNLVAAMLDPITAVAQKNSAALN